jgi:F420-non-reducing hydrogenase iron-sulfur subunit
MGINPERIRLEWISASEGKQFAALADEMTETILELGPANIKEVMQPA